MGKKNYHPKLSLQLLQQLEERYWDVHVTTMLKENGKVAREHAEWNMFNSGCTKRRARQLVAWKARSGHIRLTRVDGAWMIFPIKNDASRVSQPSRPSSGGN